MRILQKSATHRVCLNDIRIRLDLQRKNDTYKHSHISRMQSAFVQY